MSSKRQTRVKRDDMNGGKWQAQYWDADMRLWFDIGDGKDNKADAQALANGTAPEPPRVEDFPIGSFVKHANPQHHPAPEEVGEVIEPFPTDNPRPDDRSVMVAWLGQPGVIGGHTWEDVKFIVATSEPDEDVDEDVLD